MFKLILFILVIIFGSFIAAPIAIQKFAIWDASNPDDDENGINKLLYGLTPHIPPGNANQTLDIDMGTHFIDVRTKEEYDEGHIKNALNIPEQELYVQIPKQFKDKNTLIYLYCDTGRRGAVSTRLLRSMGYDRAFNIENGTKGWEKTGLHLVKPNSAYF